MSLCLFGLLIAFDTVNIYIANEINRRALKKEIRISNKLSRELKMNTRFLEKKANFEWSIEIFHCSEW
jgi:hypothetical protein